MANRMELYDSKIGVLMNHCFVLKTLQTLVTIYCGTGPTFVVNMAMKVLHNSC